MEEKQRRAVVIIGRVGIILMGMYLAILGIFLIYFFVEFWPTERADVVDMPSAIQSNVNVEAGAIETNRPEGQTSSSSEINTFLFKISNVSPEVRIILLVVIAGALGSFIHVVSSFVDYVGNKDFEGCWTWWYFLRPFSGSVLALIFYLVVRGSLLSTQIDGNDLSHYGVAGMAGLVGLFSRQAIDKLSEMFDLIFMTKKKVERKHPLKGKDK
jgi:hypothetical protein